MYAPYCASWTRKSVSVLTVSGQRFAERWAMRVRFRCAYVASGNGIAERSHRSVKRIAARKCCTIMEAVYWYNMAPKDDVDSSTAPANKLYNYEVRVLGIDRVEHTEAGAINSPYDVGDTVWVKPQGTRCNTKYRVGTVTGVGPHCGSGRHATTRTRPVLCCV